MEYCGEQGQALPCLFLGSDSAACALAGPKLQSPDSCHKSAAALVQVPLSPSSAALTLVSPYQMGTGAGLQAALQPQCLGGALSPTHLPAAEALMLAKPCDGCFLFEKFAKFPTAKFPL